MILTPPGQGCWPAQMSRTARSYMRIGRQAIVCRLGRPSATWRAARPAPFRNRLCPRADSDASALVGARRRALPPPHRLCRRGADRRSSKNPTCCSTLDGGGHRWTVGPPHSSYVARLPATGYRPPTPKARMNVRTLLVTTARSRSSAALRGSSWSSSASSSVSAPKWNAAVRVSSSYTTAAAGRRPPATGRCRRDRT